MSVKANCQFCSTVSKANGEDPIGSATPCDRWLAIEIPLPWLERHATEHQIASPILNMIQTLGNEYGIQVRMLALAPDREYSHPSLTRVLYGQRPAGLFAEYAKQEFILPSEHVVALATALLTQPELLSRFESYRHETSHIRELAVCTHGNVDVACARFGYPLYQQLRQDSAGPSLRVWRCSHFGGHNFAPTLIDLPTGQYWGHLESEILDALLERRGEVAKLRRFYRGWSGLARFEQMVERELWMQYGWAWLSYRKAGQTLAIDTTQDDKYNADWAAVRIEFESPDGRDSGAYSARVEVCGEVMTQRQSGEEHPLEPIKQYRVTELRRVA